MIHAFVCDCHARKAILRALLTVLDRHERFHKVLADLHAVWQMGLRVVLALRHVEDARRAFPQRPECQPWQGWFPHSFGKRYGGARYSRAVVVWLMGAVVARPKLLHGGGRAALGCTRIEALQLKCDSVASRRSEICWLGRWTTVFA